MNTTRIMLDNIELEVNLSPRRRSLCLKVQAQGIVLSAPTYASKSDINRFIQQNRQWIAKQALALPPKFHFEPGETILFFGKPYPLSLVFGKKHVELINGELLIASPKPTPANSKKQLENYYRQQAALYLKNRTHELARQTTLTPQNVMIRSYKARWGSCSHDGDIHLNWKLMMAPAAVIDYVIIHELCHLKHLNHRASFWRLVKKHCPDYKAHKQWLHQNTLLIESYFN